MDSRQFKKIVSATLKEAGFAQHGSRWVFETGELAWIIELEKSRYSDRWNVGVGVSLGPTGSRIAPTLNACAIQIGYELLPHGVPASAATSRFNDHRSYFSMVLDLGHDLLSDKERADAVQFMATSLKEMVELATSTEDLARLYRRGNFKAGFVSRKFKEEMESLVPNGDGADSSE